MKLLVKCDHSSERLFSGLAVVKVLILRRRKMIVMNISRILSVVLFAKYRVWNKCVAVFFKGFDGTGN